MQKTPKIILALTVKSLGACALALYGVVACAQWSWTDANGRKVFSDRPPPPDVPDARILSAPVIKPTAAVSGKPPADPSLAGNASPTPAANPKMDAASKQLEEKKKQAEAAEKAREKLEQQQAAAIKAENCNRAKAGLTNLETGAPLRSMNSKGERVFMDENTRNQEKARLQQALNTNCR